MRAVAAVLFLLASVTPLTAVAQDVAAGSAVPFHFAGRAEAVPRFGDRVELLPVLRMIGGEAAYSPAAGTWGVRWGEHEIQFSVGRRFVLVDGTLEEGVDSPVASPGGVAATVEFLDRSLLAPLGYHLERFRDGYRIVPGARLADPVAVRPAAADFSTTTTLVLTLGRSVETAVSEEEGTPVVVFDDAVPRLDPSLPFRSRRVRTLVTEGQRLRVLTADGVGMLSSHVLDGPPRVILELGAVRPTPTPAPVRIVEHAGPPPIVIDPGHGGDDTGAVSPDGLMEKEVVLGVARRLQRVLESRGHTVRLTRDEDESRALTDRTAFANRLDARVFVSLHANASTVAAVAGAETYYMSLGSGATDEAAASVAETENRGADPDQARSPLDLILWDLAQAEVLNESARLALAVQTRLNAELGLQDRGVKQAPFVVLTGATMPAILVEVGFLSNPGEVRKLSDPDHQQRIAEAVARGIEDFVNRS